MMYVPEDYQSYRYVVEYNDNYIVLTDSHYVNGSWDNPEQYNTLIQYFKPSYLHFTSSASSRSVQEFSPINVDCDFYSRADCPELMTSIYLSIFFVLFIINGLTRFVKKGGIFFGS